MLVSDTRLLRPLLKRRQLIRISGWIMSTDVTVLTVSPPLVGSTARAAGLPRCVQAGRATLEIEMQM